MQTLTFKLKTKSIKTALRTFPITLKKTKERKKCLGNETQLALKQQSGDTNPQAVENQLCRWPSISGVLYLGVNQPWIVQYCSI